MEKKHIYRVKNWGEYNKALIQRGNISVWFSEDAIQKWAAPKQPGKGRPKVYSDDAILCALLLRAVYNLPLRALQGLVFNASWELLFHCWYYPFPSLVTAKFVDEQNS